MQRVMAVLLAAAQFLAGRYTLGLVWSRFCATSAGPIHAVHDLIVRAALLFFVGYQGGGRTPSGWPHSAIRRT